MQTRTFSALLSTLALSALPSLGCAMAADDSSVTQIAEDQPSVEQQEALTSVTNSCVCIGNSSGACGNGAVGGSRGRVMTGLSTATVIASYLPDRVGSEATGWACRPEGTNTCVCIGNSSGACGNVGVGGSRGKVVTGLSTSTVITSYLPDRIGSEATGWKCRLSGI